MEDASVFEIMAWKILPEYQERFSNWISEAYYPLGIKWGRKATERYQIVKERPEYNKTVSIMYYDDFEAMINYLNNTETIYANNDLNTTYGPRREVIWGAGYQVLKSFRKSPVGSLIDLTPPNENTPVIHLEGYMLAPEELGKYHSWFARWGYQFYIPSIMKLPGLKKYSHCRILDYEQHEVSLELAAFREAMKNPFPGGLNFQWYVQYRLMRSWEK
jgi:hypothetical protein